ncbi:TAXI family TRAP transporter solute-binding subunit [Chloroflexota bacterium]
MKNRGIWIITSVLVILGLLMAGFGCATPAPAPAPAPAPKPAPVPAPTPSPTPAPKPSPTPAPTPAPSPAPAPAFPSLITMGTHNVGSATNVVGVGLSKTFSNFMGNKVNVEPRGNNMERMSLLKEGIALVVNTNAHYIYFAQAGEGEFSSADFGPQPIRMLFSFAKGICGLMSLGDSDFKNPEDIKGARVAFYPGNAGLNYTTGGALYFHGVKWSDVVKVPVSGYVKGIEAVMAGQADIAFGTNAAPRAQEAAASIHGIHWFQFPPDDTAGWERLHKVAPFDFPIPGVDFGAGVDPANPVDFWTHPHNLITYDTLPDNIAYEMTRIMFEEYEYYKQFGGRLAQTVPREALNAAELPPYPYHPGTVQYFKDIGEWTPALEQWLRESLQREAAIKARWKPHEPVYEPTWEYDS